MVAKTQGDFINFDIDALLEWNNIAQKAKASNDCRQKAVHTLRTSVLACPKSHTSVKSL